MSMTEEGEQIVWADENLDEEIKDLLTVYEKGKGMPVDIVSHLEYFYNTLDCHTQTKNPFDFPLNFPALLYREPPLETDSNSQGSNSLVEKTLFEKHRALIFPNSQAAKSMSES